MPGAGTSKHCILRAVKPACDGRLAVIHGHSGPDFELPVFALRRDAIVGTVLHSTSQAISPQGKATVTTRARNAVIRTDVGNEVVDEHNVVAMVKLQVRLQSGAAAFLAGEQVNGEVIARVDSPTKARRICVEVFGHAFNKIAVGDDAVAEAEVQFINVILLLWKPPSENVGVIEPGNYCFPFSFVIPPNALPNHRSRYGCIDYWCKAKVDRPWRPDDEVTFPFVVANIVDLKAIANSPNPVRISFEKELGCCSGSGVLSAEFGYTGGEEMLLRIDIVNASSQTVRAIHIRVAEEWIYLGYLQVWGEPREYSRCFTRDLLSFTAAVMLAPQDRDHYERRIKLPALQPSYGCKITVHKFYVEVLIPTDGICPSSLCGQVPFHVGNVPLRGAQAVSPSDKLTVVTKEDRNAAIRNVVQDEVVDYPGCCVH